jgi:ATP-dependent Clp protease ATP-binding subunit ClpB
MSLLHTNESDFLVTSDELRKQHENFELVGRDSELKQLTGILMRSISNNVLLVGPGGVGCTALCYGLQFCSKTERVPFDIASKRFYWLDVDSLFASGDVQRIGEAFNRALRTLSRSGSAVLILEDTRDFIEAARNNASTNLINSLMSAVKRNSFQLILECKDEDLDVVLKSHSDMRQLFTLLDVKEPIDIALQQIVESASRRLSVDHAMQISSDAVMTAIELTTKYRAGDSQLQRAQPERSLNIIDRALTSFRQTAHIEPPQITELEKELESTTAESARELILARIKDSRRQWEEQRVELKKLFETQTEGESLIRKLEEDLHQQLQRDKQVREAQAEASAEESKFSSFSSRLGKAGFESEEVQHIRAELRTAEKLLQDNAALYRAAVAKCNAELILDSKHVLSEFSELSGIPTEKLNQDERQKLLNLEDSLSSRVFGQSHVVQKLASAMLVGRTGLRDSNKPQAAFMFVGPSGVGKTELAKALAWSLKDDERALLRFDMSEYMEKHAAAKLIGAPPGYEGYESGGILTNLMRRNPHSIILFDEIEKAHPDVFNILLQVLDDGRLTDNRGLTVSFTESVILMTTNVGQQHFLDDSMSYEHAVEETMKELGDIYRPEFLNRFNGRENIVCFKSLGIDVIEQIARREIVKLNARIQRENSSISVVMSESALKQICKGKYDPVNGARGIPGFLNARVYPKVARTLLENPDIVGVMQINYDEDSQDVSIELLEQ